MKATFLLKRLLTKKGTSASPGGLEGAKQGQGAFMGFGCVLVLMIGQWHTPKRRNWQSAAAA